MEKLSECADWTEKFRGAFSYCESKGLLEDIAKMSLQERTEIDGWIRFKINGDGGRCPIPQYLRWLNKAVEERKSNYDWLKQETNTEDVSLCLYKMMENDLPEKIVVDLTI